MIEKTVRDSCIRYIADRRCPDGGYCFYRLNEPNAADTFFALDTLRLLEAGTADPATVDWLRTRQGENGRYHLFETGYYTLLALAILNAPPLRDPVPWIRSAAPEGTGTERPVESESALLRPHLYVHLCRSLGIAVGPAVRSALLAAVAAPRPTLIEIHHALAVRTGLGARIDDGEAAHFLGRCTHTGYGYVNVPGTAPAYLEHVAAGVAVARALRVPPAPKARNFVLRCLTPSGGFARSIFGGAATLETTWTAVRTLSLIDGREEER